MMMLGALMMMTSLMVVLLQAHHHPVSAFVQPTRRMTHRHHHHRTTPNSVLQMTSFEGDLYGLMVASRGEFCFWFMGAGGSASVARQAFPLFFQSIQQKQALKGLGPTLGQPGDPKMELSPLCFYPENPYYEDVRQVVSNPLTAVEIVEQYPIENNFLSEKGLLTYDAFQLANADCNPLAVKAVYDAFQNQQKVAEPKKVQAKMDIFRENIDGVKSALVTSSVIQLFSIFTLCCLLYFADYEAFVVHAMNGWFPNFTGFQDFPNHLLDQDEGILSIGKYYMWDLAEPGVMPTKQDISIF